MAPCVWVVFASLGKGAQGCRNAIAQLQCVSPPLLHPFLKHRTLVLKLYRARVEIMLSCNYPARPRNTNNTEAARQNCTFAAAASCCYIRHTALFPALSRILTFNSPYCLSAALAMRWILLSAVETSLMLQLHAQSLSSLKPCTAG